MADARLYHCHYNNVTLSERQMRKAIATYLAY
jgi:hypothetical protein